ncbi:unnamed protein product [Lasius platythorax]|uniref:Uncharacterized protein n=1 Tax=Lasius platythorax TaxID=488582 RepID=A0AAV2N462_9HYME
MIRSTINYVVNDDGLPSPSTFTHPRAPTSTPDREWVLRVRFVARGGEGRFWWGWNKITESTGRSSQSKLVSRPSDTGGDGRSLSTSISIDLIYEPKSVCRGYLRQD